MIAGSRSMMELAAQWRQLDELSDSVMAEMRKHPIGSPERNKLRERAEVLLRDMGRLDRQLSKMGAR